MYKVVIKVSESTIKNIQSPFRRIHFFSDNAEQKLILAEQDSHTQKMQGQIELYFNNYENCHGINNSFHLKSRGVLFLNPHKKIMNYIYDNMQEVQSLDMIITLNPIKEMKNHQKISYVVVFKSPAIAEEVTNTFNSITQEYAYVYIRDINIIHGKATKQQQKKIMNDICLQPDKWTQLPTCPKCLSLLQTEISGIAFHHPKQLEMFEAQEENKANSCSVCYMRGSDGGVCHKCDQTQDIWICLICGVLGCGRYKNADAKKHYKQTNHTLSYDIASGGIWNYSEDCFCHKVIGKQPDLALSMSEQRMDDENVQGTFWKYCSIISQQLQEQRNYYNSLRLQEASKFQSFEDQLQTRIKQLTQKKSSKFSQLKKKQKKKNKLIKKKKQIQDECEQQRIMLDQLERTAKLKIGQEQSDSFAKIQKLQKQLQELEGKITDALLKIT